MSAENDRLPFSVEYLANIARSLDLTAEKQSFSLEMKSFLQSEGRRGVWEVFFSDLVFLSDQD